MTQEEKEQGYLDDLKTAIPVTAEDQKGVLSEKDAVPEEPKRVKSDSPVFIPTPNNRPPKRLPIVMLDGEAILTYQNITVLIAPPGSGKTGVCEAICSSAINGDCDSLGLKVSTEVSKVLFIDTERTNEDVWNSYDRMNRRAKAKDSKKAQIIGLRGVTSLKARMELIENIIEDYKPELILLDGAGDFITDILNADQADLAVRWMVGLTVKYNLSIITTLHPNKGTFNPRGHIGGELLRRVHGALIIKSDGGIKTLTTDFEHGKNRNGGNVQTSFAWCDENNMFVSTDAPINPTKKIDAHIALSNEDIVKLVKDLTKEGKGAVPFRDFLKVELKQLNPNIKVGGASIKEFYTWLLRHQYITAEGSDSKKIVKQHPDIDKPAGEK